MLQLVVVQVSGSLKVCFTAMIKMTVLLEYLMIYIGLYVSSPFLQAIITIMARLNVYSEQNTSSFKHWYFTIDFSNFHKYVHAGRYQKQMEWPYTHL